MRNRLIFAIFLGCLIPYFLGGVYLNSYLEDQRYNDSIENSDQVLHQVSELIDKSLITDMKEEVSLLASLECVKKAELGINHYTDYDADAFNYHEYDIEKEIEENFRLIKESHKTTNFIFLATTSGGYMEYPRFLPKESYDPRIRPWYQKSIDQEEVCISEPYITKITNEMVVSFTKQVKKDNEVVGVVGVSVNLGELSASISPMKIGESGYILVMSPEHKFIVSPRNSEWILKTPEECGIDSTKLIEQDQAVTTLFLDGTNKVLNSETEENGWTIISVIDEKEILHGARQITMILVGIYAITFLLVFLIIYQITKRITNPIMKISSVINRMSALDFAEDEFIKKYSERSDEIGIVSKAFLEMHNKINLFFEQLTSSNKEITAKNDMLTATEEELIAQLEEINHQKEYIDFLAYHDPLTELPNRRKFIEILSRRICSEQKGAVILLDLDDFKGINDIRGHVFGDRVLETIAKRFEGAADQKLFISRFGGDEFLFLVEYENDKSEIESYVELINHIFGDRMRIEGNEIEIRYSMGIALFPEDSIDVNQLIMEADLAMYSVKNSGKNGYRYFDEGMMQYQLKISNIENILREAVKNDGFKLLYQPVVEINSGQIISYEALLRLKEYPMPPADFIDVAEKNGLILPIGRIVTEKVIRQMSEWRNAGTLIKPVSINFSANQLHDEGYIGFIKEQLDRYGIEPGFLEIEITENIFMENKQVPMEFLQQLKELGLILAIDDFGTGYSSLNYLTFLPVDIVKLDRSLNMKFLEISNVKVMESLISLVHSLGLTVVAEGIETLEQVITLRKTECDFIQGYYFSRPLEADKIPEINTITYKF
jgi:diguanylate cyclase (GGDEF)-like protein